MRAFLIATGAVLMGYAILGAATDPDLKPSGVVLFLAAVLVAHDAVLLPVTIAVGALIARFAPRWALPGIRAAATVSLAVGVVALPLVLGFGRTTDNPSILPLAYGRGLVLIVTLTWAAALASTALARHRTPTRAPAPTSMTPASHRPPTSAPARQRTDRRDPAAGPHDSNQPTDNQPEKTHG